MKNIFAKEIADQVISRINQLTPLSTALWGKMNVGQMLAHCNVAYDMTFTDKYPKPNFLKQALLKAFVKKSVVNDVPYPKNGRTAPVFIITDERDFEAEKTKLIAYIKQCQALGESHFEGKASLSFGSLTAAEWNNMFHKHLDHHLKQFGV
jgi:hypothetical protein